MNCDNKFVIDGGCGFAGATNDRAGPDPVEAGFGIGCVVLVVVDTGGVTVPLNAVPPPAEGDTFNVALPPPEPVEVDVGGVSITTGGAGVLVFTPVDAEAVALVCVADAVAVGPAGLLVSAGVEVEEVASGVCVHELWTSKPETVSMAKAKGSFFIVFFGHTAFTDVTETDIEKSLFSGRIIP